MAELIIGFEWDDGNREKCQSHGVPVAEIESMFRRTVAVIPDIAHSDAEERFKAIGRTDEGRHLFVVFARRANGALIRPISARYMHRKEIQYYEQTLPDLSE